MSGELEAEMISPFAINSSSVDVRNVEKLLVFFRKTSHLALLDDSSRR